MRAIKKIMAEITAAAVICSMVFVFQPVYANAETAKTADKAAAETSCATEASFADAASLDGIDEEAAGLNTVVSTEDYTVGYGKYITVPALSGAIGKVVEREDGFLVPFESVGFGEGVIVVKNTTESTISVGVIDTSSNILVSQSVGSSGYVIVPSLPGGNIYGMLFVFNGPASTGKIEYSLVPRDISKYTVKVNDKTYDGTSKIKSSDNAIYYNHSSGALVQGSEYTVKASTYKVGPAKVTFTGAGPFYGTKVKSTGFEIYPGKTSIKSLARGSKRFTVKWYKKTTQTSGYAIRYSTSSTMSNSKRVYVKGASTTSKTIKNLKAKKKYYVQVARYKVVGNTRYISAWSAKKAVTTK